MERGDEVIVLDDLSTGNVRRLPSGIDIRQLRVENADTADFIAAVRPQIVFHLAAQVGMGSSVKYPADDGKSNIVGTLRVLEGCREAGSKLVFSSTSGVYGDAIGNRSFRESSPKRPSAPYGLSKWVAEQYIDHGGKWWGIAYTILRYANVYSPGQTARGEGGVVACFMDRIESGLPLVIHGDGEQSRDFVHVDDVVQANLAAIDKGSGEAFNIGTGIATSINRLADRCERLAAASFGRTYEPGRSGDARCSRLSSGKAAAVLGWKPAISLDDGLSQLFKRD